MATLLFADLEMLLRALAGDVVPPPISRTPAQGSVDAQGRVWLQPTVPLPGPAVLGLQRLGVRLLDFEPEKADSLHCWQQLLPLQPRPAPADADLTFLVELPAARLSAFSGELRRLGHSAAEFRWWQMPQDLRPPMVGDFAGIFDRHIYEANQYGQATLFLPAAAPTPAPLPDDNRVLVLLKSPPLPIRLRIAQNELLAYWEQAPRVWVEANCIHAQVKEIQPPERQIALLRHDRPWVFLDDAPFYRCVESFALLRAPKDRCLFEYAEADAVSLPLKLEEYEGASAPEFWVLHERPLERFADWVRSADDSLIARLEFAVAEPRGRPIVMLRLKPSKLPTPVLMTEGLGCRRYLRLPNLYLPCGMRLAPPLRRDMVRQRLAADEQRLHVLLPGEEGHFVPVGVPVSAFHELAEWVEHCVPNARRDLTAIMETSQLGFDAFVLTQEIATEFEDAPTPAAGSASAPNPSAPGTTKEGIPLQNRVGFFQRLKQLFHSPPAVSEPPLDPVVLEQKLDAAIQQALLEDAKPQGKEKAPHNDLESRRLELEKQLLKRLGSEARGISPSLWSELAALYSQSKQSDDAAICWLNAIWEHEAPPKIWYRGWLQAERQAGRLLFNEKELLPLLQATPSPASIRLLAAVAIWLAQHGPPPELVKHAARIRQLLEEHEKWLPVRSAWLAQKTLANLCGGDQLALQRCRDRLLHRLGPNGPSLEQDVPTFLRFGGDQGGDRFRSVREWLPRLRESIQRWHGRLARNRPIDYVSSTAYPDHDGACTSAYIDLMLAWGMARLSEENSCRHLWQKSHETLARFEDPEHRFLLKAFGRRIGQAMEGKRTSSSWTEDMLAELDSWQSELADERLVLARYRVDALRQHCRILENSQRTKAETVPAPTLLHDPGEHLDRARAMLAALPENAAERGRAMNHLFGMAPRLGEVYARELLCRAESENARRTDPLMQALCLEQELLLAAQLGLSDFVRKHILRLQLLLDADSFGFTRFLQSLLQGGGGPYAPVELVRLEEFAGNCLGALRRDGMTAEVKRLRLLAERWILQGVSLGRLQSEQPNTWTIALRALLHLGTNVWANATDPQALATLDFTRQALYQRHDLAVSERVALACAYIRALAHAPPHFAQERIEELFLELDGLHDARKTNTHFALSPLAIVDAVVMAIIEEGFTLDPAARHWLEDDELSIRCRLRNDLQQNSG
jgi:hypothetical protein